MRIWTVYIRDLNNRDKIRTFNIFEHFGFREDTERYLKKYKNKEEFAEHLKRSLMYYFWAKFEWETVVTTFPPYISVTELERLNTEREQTLKERNREPYMLNVNLNSGEKIDVYNQVMNNWDVFLDYVWNSKIRRPRRVEWDENSVPFCNVCPKCGLVIDRTAIKNNSGKLHFCPNCGNSMKN